MLARLSLFIVIIFLSTTSNAAVILQYHHVSDSTPPSTSISPSQFRLHMQYLKDNNFKVVAVNQIIEAIKTKQPMTQKWVAITFDDAFDNILENGTPILEEFGYPYTIFINPSTVNNPSYLKWEQLASLSDKGVIIANHGFNHDSLARTPAGKTEAQWMREQKELLLKSEELIEKNTGQSWRYFAYPYGEYTPEIQQWLEELGFIGFTQQSGAVGVNSHLTIIPRFPASKPYDQITSLQDKLNSLPMNISLNEVNAGTIFEYGQPKSVTFNIDVEDFNPLQLNCYVSGLGHQKTKWLNDKQFSITFDQELPVGRVRCNCTAPSINEPGRFYWYSKPWFILNQGGEWYPL
jgi:peptidoglycan/xylan/chitin deacetylase (PgdA/CDA1 family)